MEYPVTKQNIKSFLESFSPQLEVISRPDGISNIFNSFDWELHTPFFTSSYRGAYIIFSPLFIDLTAIDEVGFNKEGAGVERFSLWTVSSSLVGVGSFPIPLLTRLGFTGTGEFCPLFSIPTFSFLYGGAQWAERECWDMFGIVFEGNSDLRRLLTDYGFSGFPLRKDFPVVGFFETHYDDELLQLRLEKISLAQEMRPFLFQSGATIV